MVRVILLLTLFCWVSQPVIAAEDNPQDLMNEIVVDETTDAIILEQLGLNFKVQNMIEGFYDNDANGRLQNIEVLYFLADVLKAVEKNGRFEVVSPILSKYDTNRDGRITKREAIDIEAYLY